MKRTPGAMRTSMLLGLGGSSLLAVASLAACGGSESPGTGGTGTTTSSETTTSTSTTSTGTGTPCGTPNDCPDTGNECVLRVCVAGQCGTLNAPVGTPGASQTDGDCKLVVCDGNGATTTVDDDADLVDDAKQCTIDRCANGTLSHDPAAAGAACSENGGSRCDGKGACVQCNADADCAPGAVCSGGACVAPTCADGVKNGTETDLDCGGSCAPCAVDRVCAASKDCQSGLCAVGKCATTQPIINNLSANGHDRLFNMKFDAMGSIIAVGVSAPGTDTATDYSTIVAKFTPQGVLDKTWATQGVFTKNIAVGTNGELARAIGFQSNGKIIIGATVEQIGAADPRDRDVAFIRLGADGTLDTTFGTNGVSIVDLAPGVVNGSGFSTDSIWHLVVQPDDKIVFHGSMARAGNADTDYVLARLNPNGGLDTTFGTNGKVSIDVANVNGSARSLTLLPNGAIMGAGYADISGVGTPVLWKVTSAGVLDTTFASGGIYNAVLLPAQTEAYAVALQGNKYVTTGYGRANATTESVDWLSLRFLANGTLDTTYGNNGIARLDVAGFADQSRWLITLPDDRVLLAGAARPTSNNVDGAVALLTPNGQPDTTFSPTGVRLFDLGGANDFLNGMELAPSGDYVALAGVKGIATGGTGNDDTALLLVPIK